MQDNAAEIARLNDVFRKTMGGGGRIYQTQWFLAMSEEEQAAIRKKVEDFTDFTPDNDPYGERDFGSVTHNGIKVFWKIDCYAPDMMQGSEDPSDPSKTLRVLTLMLAEEY
jgi:hypothetical protein